MAVINCTPHDINLVSDGEVFAVIQPSGIVPRCTVERKEVRRIEVNGHLVPINQTVFGEVYDLPEESDSDLLVVSRAVINALHDKGIFRDDLVSPDVTVRNDKGQIVGCIALAL